MTYPNHSLIIYMYKYIEFITIKKFYNNLN
jgi:hypothetical protein